MLEKSDQQKKLIEDYDAKIQERRKQDSQRELLANAVKALGFAGKGISKGLLVVTRYCTAEESSQISERGLGPLCSARPRFLSLFLSFPFFEAP